MSLPRKTATKQTHQSSSEKDLLIKLIEFWFYF